jgi:subtilisin-like proprotein convertase family protein
VKEKLMKAKKVLLGLFLLLATAFNAQAQIVETYTFTTFGGQPSLAIADGNGSGVSDLRQLNSSITAIGSLTVSLNISGEFNGDLYAYLRHGDTGFSILLNRPGRNTGSPSGYGDSGFNIALSDSAPNGDIHNYRAMFTPEVGSPLTGLWQADGRNVDPSIVLDSTARTATLSSFSGLSASGDWTLFLADMQSGGTSALESWSLNVAGAGLSVPEPYQYALVVGGGLIVWRRLARSSR